MTRILATCALLLTGCQGSGSARLNVPAAEMPAKKEAATYDAGKAKSPGPGTIEVKHGVAWLKAYMELGEALVHSDAIKATFFAQTMAASTPPESLKTYLSSFPSELKGQRLRFAKISAELHKAWSADPALQAGTVIMHCPMVPADWIQPAGTLRNPYMPETMLHCGYQVAPTK